MVNGIQVGSTKDIGSACSEQARTSRSVPRLSSRPARRPSSSIFADAKDTAGTNITTGGSVVVSLMGDDRKRAGLWHRLTRQLFRHERRSGNTIIGDLFYAHRDKVHRLWTQTVIAGTNNVKLGAFTLSTGSTEGVTVNTIAITLAGSERRVHHEHDAQG